MVQKTIRSILIMGQAKQRGTFDERVKCSIAAQQIIKQAYPVERFRRAKLASYNSNKVLLAMDIVRQAREIKSNEPPPKFT